MSLMHTHQTRAPAGRTAAAVTALRLLIPVSLMLAACLPPAALAAVYKTTDAEGNVIYTDVPPAGAEGQAEAALELPDSNTYQPVVPAGGSAAGPGQEEEEQTQAFGYEQLTITAPADDQAIRANAGNLTVYTQVQPQLQDGHQVQILLDGQPWPVRSAGAVAMTNIDRGTHTLTAQVVDENLQVLISSAPVTFHMLRVSVLTRPRPNAN